MAILYCVPWSSCKAEIKQYCLGSCGEGLIAGVKIEGIAIAPCKTAECEYVAETLDLGEYIVPSEGKMDIVIRKLIEVT